MTSIRFGDQLEPNLCAFAEDYVQTLLNSCDPAKLIRDQFVFDHYTNKTHVLAFGKASVAMASECATQLGSRFAGGVVLAPAETIPHQHNEHLRFFAADHPLPTQRNIDATQQLVQYARSIPNEEHCIVCISGGGSAHLCSPRDGVSLNQVIGVTQQLNAQGATIGTLNCSRKELETLKSGGLARVFKNIENCEAIVLSDVLGNDLSTIASGPMYDEQLRVPHHVIGDHRTLLSTAAGYMDSRSMRSSITQAQVRGSSAGVGRVLAERFLELGGITPHLIAGETTVDTQSASGVGGPMLELVLSTARELSKAECDAKGWIVLGLASDGIDGPSGAAGAVVCADMLRDPQTQEAATIVLQSHDSLPFLESLSAVFWTGPTGTNVNDVCLVCTDPRK